MICVGVGTAWGQEEPGIPADPEAPAAFAIVTEDELAPALDSNRQPIGPDPLEWPQWTDAEAAAMDSGRPPNLGGGLWSPARFPLQPVPELLGSGEPREAAVPPSPGGLDLDQLAPYRLAREWCVDPHRLLSDARRERIEAHLAAQAASAVHPVRLWVLAPGQSVDPAVDVRRLREEMFGLNSPGVLAVAALDRPEQGWCAGPFGLIAAEKSGVRDDISQEADAVVGRLEAWVVRQALDAYRLPDPRAAEVASRAPIVVSTAPDSRRWRVPLAGWLAAAVAAAVLTAAVVRRRRPCAPSEAPCVWLEIDRPPRLGGAHSGGAGASLDW